MNQGDDEVPKLPRGKGLTLSSGQMMRIGMTLVTLLAIVVLRRPCSDAVGRFVTTFGGPTPNGTSAAPIAAPGSPVAAPAAVPSARPIAPAPVYERLTPSMTDGELRAAWPVRSRRAAAAAGTPAPGLAPDSTAPSAEPRSKEP
jgi:hypothetical protein